MRTIMEMLKEKEKTSLLWLDDIYNVVLHDDDVTPVEYVFVVLKSVFFFSDDRAKAIIIKTMKEGETTLLSTSKSEAEAFISSVNKLNREYGFALRVTMERM